MAHGLSAVKEHGLDDYAVLFREAGMAVLVYDHRNLGASDGEPRQVVNPWAQTRDFRYARAWLADRSEVDPLRIALWGSSFSSSEVVVLAAIDGGVAAVVANVPFCGFGGDVDEGAFGAMRSALDDETGSGPADAGEVAEPVAVIDEPGSEVQVLFPGPEAAAFFARPDARRWVNRVSMQSAFTGTPMWDPGPAYAHLEAPLLMVVAAGDELAPAELAETVSERVPAPKRLELVPTSHFEAYSGPAFERGSTAMLEFLTEHLDL